MTARGAGILGSVTFILLLSFGSYLLDVPMAVVTIAAVFAIGVILWVGTRGATPPRSDREVSGISSGESPPRP